MKNVDIVRILPIVSILTELVSLGALQDTSITCAKHVYTFLLIKFCAILNLPSFLFLKLQVYHFSRKIYHSNKLNIMHMLLKHGIIVNLNIINFFDSLSNWNIWKKLQWHMRALFEPWWLLSCEWYLCRGVRSWLSGEFMWNKSVFYYFSFIETI